MRTAIKKQGKTIKAWVLGGGSSMEKRLLEEGKLVLGSPGTYQFFSQEALGVAGEYAGAGDYIKMDSAGFPYPNTKAFFEANHTPLGGDYYIQHPKPLSAWFLGDPQDEVIRFLLHHKGLKISPDDAQTCFTAPLWGTTLTAKRDAAIVIYAVERAEDGQIQDVDFNFVSREEFDKTYTVISDA